MSIVLDSALEEFEKYEEAENKLILWMWKKEDKDGILCCTA